MKEGLIRLTDEKDIFYDSIEKVYRYRMHCSYCDNVIPRCQCYHDLDKLLEDIDEGIADYACSYKCSLMGGEWDELEEAMCRAGIHKNTNDLIKTLSDEQIREYLTKEYDGHNICCCWDKYKRKNLLLVIKENRLEDEILEYFKISKGKTVEELTEEEAKKVVDILCDEYDFDFPRGEECAT